MMDQDADISGTKARMPVQPIPDITQEVLETYADRETGFRSKKTFTVSPTLKACAEDELVKKDYKEMRCEIPGLTKSTFLMVFSPDGTKMASTHGNHNVYVTDLRTGKNIKTLVGHPRTPWCVAFHPSSNQILASGCLGGQVRIWDLSGGSEVWTAESQTVISSLAFHPVDRLLVIATYNELYFWDWSQPKPFMQTCTSNAKEKVRYVAFDRLGHKLITGIANTPQGFTRWERVRAPVPVARSSDRITAYRRRITPRIVTSPQMNNNTTATTPPTPPENPPNNQNSIPERERRIATCYRNLVEHYEMLVHRYLEAYRPATTIDRGTDPMEAEHLNNNTDNQQPSTSGITTTSEASTSTASISITIASSATPQTTSSTSQTTAVPSSQSSSQTTRNSPPCVPGPSGLSRFSRPNKRSNVPGSKSDSSTVYQSDSSSSSSSDESPTPKRRISLVPNSNLFRNKSEASVNKSTKDNGTGTRKKLFISRPSAFHSTRSNPNVSNTSGINNRRVYDRFLPNPTLSSLDTRLSELPEQRARNPIEQPAVNSPAHPAAPSSSSNSRFDNLPLLLRGISEGTLSSADEVINFSERPIRDEPEAEPPENFTIQSPAEFANQATGIENMYGHILTDLETTLREARDFRIRRTEERRNNLNRNVFLSFSERLENIMNQSDGILANLRRSVELLMDPSIQRQLQPETNRSTNAAAAAAEASSEQPSTPRQQLPVPSPCPATPPSPSPSENNPIIDPPTPETPPNPIVPSTSSNNTPSTSSPLNAEADGSQASENARNKIYILRKPSGFHRQYSPRAGTSSRTNPSFQTYPGNARFQRFFRIRQPRLNVRPHNSSSSVWRPFDDHSYPRDPEQTNNTNSTNESQRSNVEPIRSLLTLSPRSPSTAPAEPEDNSESQAEQSDPDNSRTSQFRPDPRLVDPVTGNRGSDDITAFGSDPITDHNYSGDPQTSIADHTYPRDPQSPSNNPPDYIAPLVSSLHSTISHISRQTNMLRRQVESIELIDRARFEVLQLQEMRRMWEDVRRHLSFVNSSTSERRSNLSNVRQMMAWTRISDPSPSSESAQSSTEQSTPEPSTERPTPSTSRSSASSSNESRTHPNQFLNRFRQSHIKKRMYWRRRAMKNENPHCNPRRYLRGHSYRDVNLRTSRSDFPNRSFNWNLTEVTVTLMIRWLEHLLTQQTFLLERRDQPNPPDRTNMEYRIQSERIIQSRLRAARQRLNRVSGQNPPGINLDDPVEFSSVGSRNEWIRYEARLRLSGYVETLSRFIESHNSIPPGLHDHLKIMLELAVLLTDLLLLQIMESIPYLSGSILDPERDRSERDRLSRRISQMCTNMLSNSHTIRLGSLIRVLHFRINSRPTLPGPNQESETIDQPEASNRPEQPIPGPSGSSGLPGSGRNTPRGAEATAEDQQNMNRRIVEQGTEQAGRLLQSIQRSTVELNRSNVRDFNRHLRSLYQIRNMLNDPDSAGIGASTSAPPSTPPQPPPPTTTLLSEAVTPPPPTPNPPIVTNPPTTTTSNNPSTSTENSMAPVYRLTDLLSRLRSVRGRLEQVSQNFNLGRSAHTQQPGNSSSTTEHEPMRSTDESPSDDRESEPFEGFQSQWDQPLHDTSERLYRTQHINLYPPDPPSSSQSSPERNVQSGSARYWNVPTVQVNDVPVAEVIQNSPRIWLHRYPSDLRPLSAATGLFRPRFLIPLYAGVNPFDQDLDDPQREGPVGYDGIISTTVSPNHRIQMWDISKCNIPNISNHEKNIVVSECKIHNDGSVDISSDGTLLVTLLPSGGYLNVTNRLGIYSIKWDTLGQCLYTTSFEQNAISVSLSPLSRHLIVGLASRRVTLLPSDRWTMARIFLLDDRKIKIMGGGRLVVLRDLEQGRERDLNFMSVNCIKWMPVSGQGIVYATNTGQLKVLT